MTEPTEEARAAAARIIAPGWLRIEELQERIALVLGAFCKERNAAWMEVQKIRETWADASNLQESEAKALEERIASLEAEFARLRKERDAIQFEAGGLESERNALLKRLSPERLREIVDSLQSPLQRGEILTVLQRELGEGK